MSFGIVISVIFVLIVIVVGGTFLGLYLNKSGPFSKSSPTTTAATNLSVAANTGDASQMAITADQLAKAVKDQKDADIALMTSAETASETALNTLKTHDASILAAQSASDAANQVIALQNQQKNSSEQIASEQAKYSTIASENIILQQQLANAIAKANAAVIAAAQSVAVSTAVVKPYWTMVSGINYGGNDIPSASMTNTNANLCQVQCSTIGSNCVGALFDNSSNICYPKSKLVPSGLYPKDDVYVTPNTTISGYDFYGNDIASVTNSNPDACRASCKLSQNCLGGVLATDTNTCFLKNKLVASSVNPNRTLII